MAFGRRRRPAPELNTLGDLALCTWDANRTFARSDRAIADKQLWRAKEILQGNIATQGLHAELYERYGQLLVRMGDLVDAGKYLFLSGARSPEYEATIQLFLDKHHRDPERIFNTLPSRAKWAPWEDYPIAVRRDMGALGFTQPDRRVQAQTTLSGKDKLAISAVILIVLTLLSCVVVGAAVLIRLAWSVFAA